MPMQVLLRRTIDGIGRVGEIVRVRNGYARNYLLPNDLAALVSADALAQVEKDKEREAVRQSREDSERATLAERLGRLTLTIEARAGDDGHLYGSVGPRQVAQALAAAGYQIEERSIRVEPIRELGAYEAPVHLTREHVVPVKLQVVQDAREAAETAAAAADEERQNAT